MKLFLITDQKMLLFVLKNCKELCSEVYVNSRDYVDLSFGGILKLIKIIGLKKTDEFLRKIKPYEFQLDRNMEITKQRLKK